MIFKYYYLNSTFALSLALFVVSSIIMKLPFNVVEYILPFLTCLFSYSFFEVFYYEYKYMKKQTHKIDIVNWLKPILIKQYFKIGHFIEDCLLLLFIITSYTNVSIISFLYGSESLASFSIGLS
jgi:hypothetical protein